MIYLTGDIHASFKDYRLGLLRYLKEDDIVIFLGDFGFNWNNTIMECFKDHFTKFSCTVLFLSGNHENFDILKSLPSKEMFGGEVGVFCEKVYHLKTGEIYTIDGKKFLVFGGALSIDKEYRILGTSYWEEEIPSIEDFHRARNNLIRNDCKVDYLLTHTCSDIVVKELFKFSKIFEDKTSIMIRVLESEIKSPYINYFGHFHEHVEKGNHKCLYTEMKAIELPEEIV